ncbi:MAG: DUF4260 domain-containing protein [Pseudomonadota bacterium]
MERGQTTGHVRIMLRVEGAVAAGAAIWAYALFGASWWLFSILIFLPDVGMLGYLMNRRVGAWIYNLTHTYSLPIIIATLGGSSIWPFALIWVAHIGLDRVLGYGLKYTEGFKTTHLSGGV